MYDSDGTDRASNMLFNTGVMFSRGTDFWSECYNWLSKEPQDLQSWYGDQRAVFEVASRGHYRVLTLPCKDFNWAPNSRDETSEARFFHYKGGIRKKWIPGYVPLSGIAFGR